MNARRLRPVLDFYSILWIVMLRKLWVPGTHQLRWSRVLRGARMSASPSPTLLSPDILIEEEKIPGYDPKKFFPVNPGDLLNNRYRIVAKVGWGTTSTVWLAQDIQRRWWNSSRYVTLKIAVSDFTDEDAAQHELNIAQSLQENPSHVGFQLVRIPVDNFEAIGPEGKHVCLVYEPMREPLWLLQERMPNKRIPPSLLKVYIAFFLKALDYLHSECRIIHTDLKMDNILVGFENPSVLEEYVAKQAENPMLRKIKDGRSIYLSHNDFGPMKSFVVLPKIADFGLAQYGDVPEPLRHPIQPPLYQAPEVLLGTSWTYSVDIWNLGLLIWNMMEGRDLFQHIRSGQGDHDVRAHFAEMIALFGPPPKKLLDRENSWNNIKWSHAIMNPNGKLCESAREYFGGPFFDSEGEFMHKHLIPTNVSLEDSVTSLEGEEKRHFLNFARKMLQWLPERRESAKELLEDPWLGS